MELVASLLVIIPARAEGFIRFFGYAQHGLITFLACFRQNRPKTASVGAFLFCVSLLQKEIELYLNIITKGEIEIRGT